MNVRNTYGAGIYNQAFQNTRAGRIDNNPKIHHIDNWDRYIRQFAPKKAGETASETYTNMRNMSANTGNLDRSQLSAKSYALMTDYYKGDMSREDIKKQLEVYVRQAAETGSDVSADYTKNQIRDTISTLYEYFQRANVRNAVAKNNEEAADYWVETGVKDKNMDQYSKLQGTVYYNAEYYFQSEEMQQYLKDALDGLLKEYDAGEVDYGMIEKNTAFSLDGGLSYNGVWNYTQYQTNHHWMDQEGKTSIVEDDFIPQKNFVYSFTHDVSSKNVNKIKSYLDRLKSAEQRKEKDEDAGMTQKQREAMVKRMLAELRYGGTSRFLNNTFSSKGNNMWNFLTPSNKSNFQDYYRAVRYTEK